MWQPQGFYNQYMLRTPVVLLGDESVRGLYNYPAGKVAVIHGSSFSGQELFTASFSKRDICFIKRSWSGEPDMESLSDTIRQIEEYKPDTIIAVGGGSVIDGAKLCRLFYEFPFFDANNSKIDGSALKTNFIAVPTTFGSGSEVSSAAVFVDHLEHRKNMVVLHELLPDVVVYDKRYIADSPMRLLCASALDAMAHILEGYVSVIDNTVMDILAEEGMSILNTEFGKLLDGSKENADLERLQYAGFIGGLVQNHCIVGAAHAIAHQLTEHGFSHGEAVGLLLPATIKANSADKKSRERYTKIATRAGFGTIENMTSFIYSILRFSCIDDSTDSLRAILEKLECDAVFLKNVKNDRSGKGNPVKMTDEYINRLIGSI